MTSTARAPQTDHQVKQAVVAELDWIPNLRADRVGVAVTDGAVTLSGQVQTYPEKRSAVQAAFRVRGVSAVADELDVHHSSTPRSDTDIATATATVLGDIAFTGAGAVRAEVHDGSVTLTGSVAWEYERESVRRAVAAVAGVRGVVNDITLAPTVHVVAGAARTRIADALRRNASIEADNIRIEVVGSRIVLGGHVATWAERTQVEHAAWATPGVTHVENNVFVRR